MPSISSLPRKFGEASRSSYSARAPLHRGGMMAERPGKSAVQHLFRERLTIKVGGAYIPPPRCAAAQRDGAPAKLITVSWFLVWLWLEERGFEALRLSGRRRWRSSRRRLLFEIVDRKKEKRRRRSPCGLFLCGRKPVLERSKRNFGGPTFRFIKLCSITARASGTGSTCLGLVKRCDRADQDLKLESLILAQSERWRQA